MKPSGLCATPRVEVVEPACSDAAVVSVAAAGSPEVASHVLVVCGEAGVAYFDGVVVGVHRRSSRGTNSSCTNPNYVTPCRELENDVYFVLDRLSYTSEPRIRVRKCLQQSMIRLASSCQSLCTIRLGWWDLRHIASYDSPSKQSLSLACSFDLLVLFL